MLRRPGSFLRREGWASLLLAIVAVGLSPGWARTTSAATFSVDRIDDDVSATTCDDAAPNDCSLRGAIITANTQDGADTITLPAGTYTLTIAGAGEDAAARGDLDITGDLTLNGAGADTTIVSGVAGDRVFHVDPNGGNSNVSMNGVTVQNGSVIVIAFVEATGGGILVGSTATAGDPVIPSGTLTLTDCVIQGNSSEGRGGGVANKSGTLVMIRSRVSHNAGAGGGGGIVSRLTGQTTLVDSTVSDNSSDARDGGGINISGVQTTVLNSTISGNTARGQGGGIARFSGTLTMTNSTVSGNTAGDGGGIYSHYNDNLPNTLNNCTIADNHALGFVTFGGSGGGISSGGPFTLNNTIAAGNTLASGNALIGSDCVGTLTSAGYNLIQNFGTPCSLTGDLTGNIIGQDPQLGPLASNGGTTQTHALLSNSPAIDAGSPAAPGSGGNACTAIDQRGFIRPFGAACDIGAFERLDTLSVSSAVPNHGGRTGSVTAFIYGNGFESGATVKLSHMGEPDITGSPTTVDVGGSLITATFNLTGATTGARDLVVTNPDGTSASRSDGFTIEETQQPQLWVNVIGSSPARIGRAERYFVLFGNRGNVDATAVPSGLVLPRTFAPALEFDVLPPPPHPDQVPTDWELLPITVLPDERFATVEMLLPVVPAGSTGALSFTLAPPVGLPVGSRFVAIAGIDAPIFNPQPDGRIIQSLAAEAKAYAQDNLGVTIPAEMLPDLEQYLTAQLQSMIDSGRAALADSAGTQPPVYSLSQLTIDAAQFGAAHVGASAQSSNGWAPRFASWLSSTLERLALLFQPNEALAAKCLPGKKCKPHGPKPIPTPPGGPTHEPVCSGSSFFLSAFFGGQTGGGSPCVPQKCLECTDDGNGGLFCSANECSPGGGPVILSHDPNDKFGPGGVGAARFQSADIPLSYGVSFENVATATAPAQDVVITDQLDVTNMDLGTFSFGPISFGEFALLPPPGLSQYIGGMDLRPEQNLLVTVDARLDATTGVVTWRFTSIDPATLQHTEEATAGFLPPNVTPPAGEGSVLFTVKAKPGRATGAQICNQATIVFDVNAPIDTPQWCNTIDVTPPQSHVLPLAPRQTDPTFLVQWAGTDDGAGIGDFTIYVSEDGGAFAPLLSNTRDTSLMFTGQDGKRYAFCSLSRDRTGTVEEKACPGEADATTRVSTGPACVGDCDDDGSVGIAELVTGVTIALGQAPVPTCPAFDRDRDGRVGIDELVAAVSRALAGCEMGASARAGHLRDTVVG